MARIGGDEFVVLCPGAGTLDVGEAVAGRIVEAMNQPFVVGGHRQWVRASIGLVLAPEDASAEQVLGDADAAMYAAKAGARGGHVVFDPRMREQAVQRLRISNELRDAITGGQLRCHLQPIVDLSDGRPVGLEALVRWQHRERGLLPPAAFLGVAQQSGLMDELGAEVLRQACAALSDLRRTTPAAARMHVTVNVSGSQLGSPDLVGLVAGLLEEHDLEGEPGALRLEVTESLFMDRDTRTHEVLEGLRALGVTILVDDFGTGFSSLSRLTALPIDGLKIDRSFVEALGRDGTGDASLITAILDLGAALHLEVVCEGVETEPQRRRLETLGGVRAQGHLFAKALPPAGVRGWLLDGT